MKPERPTEDHEPVRKLMREWKITASLPPRFTEGVWRRIEEAAPRAKPALWSGMKDWLAAFLPRPAIAIPYVTVLLVAGMVGGYWQARNHAAHLNDELGARYVQSVDPYQKPRI